VHSKFESVFWIRLDSEFLDIRLKTLQVGVHNINYVPIWVWVSYHQKLFCLLACYTLYYNMILSKRFFTDPYQIIFELITIVRIRNDQFTLLLTDLLRFELNSVILSRFFLDDQFFRSVEIKFILYARIFGGLHLLLRWILFIDPLDFHHPVFDIRIIDDRNILWYFFSYWYPHF